MFVYGVYVFVCMFVFDVSVCGCNCGIEIQGRQISFSVSFITD